MSVTSSGSEVKKDVHMYKLQNMKKFNVFQDPLSRLIMDLSVSGGHFIMDDRSSVET